MADIQENLLENVTDFKEVRVIANDDSSKTMTKDQFTKVLEGRMGNPLGYRNTTVSDLNTVIKPGIYYVNQSAHGVSNSPIWVGYIIVINDNSNSVPLQFAVSVGNDNVSRRCSTNKGATWSDWKAFQLV